MLLCRQCSGGSTEGSFLCGHIIVYLYLTTVDVLFPNWTPFILITYSCAPFFFYFLWNLFFCFHKLILFEVLFQFFVLDSQCRTKWHKVNKYFRSSSIFLLKINQYDKAEHYLKVAPISRLPLLYIYKKYPCQSEVFYNPMDGSSPILLSDVYQLLHPNLVSAIYACPSLWYVKR